MNKIIFMLLATLVAGDVFDFEKKTMIGGDGQKLESVKYQGIQDAKKIYNRPTHKKTQKCWQCEYRPAKFKTHRQAMEVPYLVKAPKTIYSCRWIKVYSKGVGRVRYDKYHGHRVGHGAKRGYFGDYPTGRTLRKQPYDYSYGRSRHDRYSKTKVVAHGYSDGGGVVAHGNSDTKYVAHGYSDSEAVPYAYGDSKNGHSDYRDSNLSKGRYNGYNDGRGSVFSDRNGNEYSSHGGSKGYRHNIASSRNKKYSGYNNYYNNRPDYDEYNYGKDTNSRDGYYGYKPSHKSYVRSHDHVYRGQSGVRSTHHGRYRRSLDGRQADYSSKRGQHQSNRHGDHYSRPKFVEKCKPVTSYEVQTKYRTRYIEHKVLGDSGGFDACRGPLDYYYATEEGVNDSACDSNCYVKKDSKGNLSRGCYSGQYKVDPNRLGCHYQGDGQKELYCFCKGDHCNGNSFDFDFD